MALIRVGNDAWLVAYDISNPRRLGRVGRWVREFAMPVQYSLYLGLLGDSELKRLVAGLEARIRQSEDDVRLYHLPALLHVDSVGAPLADPGLIELAPIGTTPPLARDNTNVMAGIQWTP